MRPAGPFKLEHLRGSRDGVGAEIISHTFFLLVYAFFYIYIIFMYLFIVGSAGSSLLRGLCFSCGERGLLFVAVLGPLLVVASLVWGHRL